MTNNKPQVKICGLTDAEQARTCVEFGADAIGLVFYPESPRNLSEEQAREITAALPTDIRRVGVFVDEDFPFIMGKVSGCGLNAVQLHGQEDPEVIELLAREGILVIKGLFTTRKPALEDAHAYRAGGFLVECGKGTLPGGNAEVWNWGEAKTFGETYPLILAGGLTPENVADAVTAAEPDAVDVSSGVESAPGQKDMKKVQAFFENLSSAQPARNLRRIF